jgi:hypothetical protein
MSEPFHDHLISIRNDLRPGDVGYITYLHGILYAPEQGWDNTLMHMSPYLWPSLPNRIHLGSAYGSPKKKEGS